MQMNYLKKNWIYSVFAVLILLYSFSTITQAWYPFSLNRAFTAGMILCLLLILAKDFTKFDVLLMCGLGISIIFSTLISNDLKRNTNDCIYFFTATLFYKVFAKWETREQLAHALTKCGRLFYVIIYGCIGIMFISLFWDSSYVYRWGTDIRYFCGFALDPHTMSPSVCLIMALFVFSVVDKGFRIENLVLLLFLQYTIFMSGARTFAITSTLVIIAYINSTAENIKSKYIRFAITACIILICFALSPMTNKLQSTVGETELSQVTFNQFSNGRISIWSCLMDAYAQQGFIPKLFGCGFDQVYGITEKALGIRLWAHNDFLHLLIGTGILGLSVYLLSLLFLFIDLFKRNHFITALAMLCYVLFPSVLNGFWFTYFHLFLGFILMTLYSAKSKHTGAIKDT